MAVSAPIGKSAAASFVAAVAALCLLLAVPAQAQEQKPGKKPGQKPPWENEEVALRTADFGLESYRGFKGKVYVLPSFSYGGGFGNINLRDVLNQPQNQRDEWEQSTRDWGFGGTIGFSQIPTPYGSATQGRDVLQVYSRPAYELRIDAGRGDGDVQPEGSSNSVSTLDTERFSLALVGLYEIVADGPTTDISFYSGVGLGYSWEAYDFVTTTDGPTNLVDTVTRAKANANAPELVMTAGTRVYIGPSVTSGGLFLSLDFEARFSYNADIGHLVRSQAGIGYAF